MDIDDLEPRKRQPEKKNLEIMGVDELKEYIAGLEAEIERAKAEIDRKQSHRSGIEDLFKK